MYMGVVDRNPGSEAARQLRDARVLVTGLSCSAGVDVARTFADLNSRLVVHTTDLSPEMTAVVALLSQSAKEIKLYTNPVDTTEASVILAQTAAQAFGGLEAVINFASFSQDDIALADTVADVEAIVASRLAPLFQITRVSANRMRVVQAEGMILNVVTMATPRNAREAGLASIVRSMLAHLTRGLAAEWADQKVRVNSVGPRVLVEHESAGACLASEPDIAALAVFLATTKASNLSGHVFDLDRLSEN